MNDKDTYTCAGPGCEITSSWGWVREAWIFTSEVTPWPYFHSHECFHAWEERGQ